MVSTPGHPVKGRADRSCFKVYALDVGLLGAMANISPDLLTHGHRLFHEYKGAFTENYVAQQLRSRSGEELYYLRRDGQVVNIPLYALSCLTRLVSPDGASHGQGLG